MLCGIRLADSAPSYQGSAFNVNACDRIKWMALHWVGITNFLAIASPFASGTSAAARPDHALAWFLLAFNQEVYHESQGPT
jgi:hypothetical protein